jgi:hypothetical protein
MPKPMPKFRPRLKPLQRESLPRTGFKIDNGISGIGDRNCFERFWFPRGFAFARRN